MTGITAGSMKCLIKRCQASKHTHVKHLRKDEVDKYFELNKRDSY